MQDTFFFFFASLCSEVASATSLSRRSRWFMSRRRSPSQPRCRNGFLAPLGAGEIKAGIVDADNGMLVWSMNVWAPAPYTLDVFIVQTVLPLAYLYLIFTSDLLYLYRIFTWTVSYLYLTVASSLPNFHLLFTSTLRHLYLDFTFTVSLSQLYLTFTFSLPQLYLKFTLFFASILSYQENLNAKEEEEEV